MNNKNKLSALRLSRGNLKGTLTRCASFTEKITEVITPEDLEVRLEKLDELWVKFNSSQELMYELAGEEGYVDPETEFEDFESKYLVVKSVLLSALRERQKIESDKSPNGTPLHMIAAPSQQTNPVQQFNDYLPKIHIEPFSGSYRDWPAFRDMYESSIHNKSSLSPTQKFQLLRSCLRGEALSLLTHLPISDATYELAWERLGKRYDRPRYILNHLLETFMQLPSTQGSNVKILRKISDSADEVVRGLNSLNSYERDPWMIYALISKVDPETRQAWSADSVDIEYPTVSQFLTFLERRCEALESCRGHVREQNRGKPVTVRSMHVSAPNQCPKCSYSHLLPECAEFIAMNVDEKRDFVKSKRLCFNCLRSGHNSARCQSKFRCKNCNSRHHSLVHLGTAINAKGSGTFSENISSQPSSSNKLTSSSHSSLVTNHSIYFAQSLPQSLLPTAVGKIIDRNGKPQLVRILIDSGSQVSFITESCVQRLGLNRTHARIPISGIGATCAGSSRGLVSVLIASCYDTVSIQVDTYILSTLTSALPNISFDTKDWDHISKLELADPSFNRPSEIDILLGADKAWDILQGDVIHGVKGRPIAHKTIFGWVLAGRLVSAEPHNIRSFHVMFDVDSALQAFWEIEEVAPKAIISGEDQAIEQHFAKTHRRDEQGRYIVKLPFTNPPSFSDTLGGAIARLKSMERKFSKSDSLLESYSNFLDEYLALGHMRQIPPSEIVKPNVFYLPHHAVHKSGTKLRVVFDGSFKDTTGNSLNECLMIGPPIQRNLFSVCLRFRRHKYVFTADIIKMFRQIRVAEEDTDYQRIVWRKSPTEPFEHFRLCTVTYGTSCAPYLSVRVLEQLSRDYREEHPVAAEILGNDFYVDDVVSGGDSIEDALYKKQCLIELLSKAGLILSKWQSNCPELLAEKEHVQSENISLDSDKHDPWVKILGLYWNSKLDHFSFRLNLTPDQPATKRQILRDVARIFDPLGFLTPSVVQLKMLLQELWLQKLNWDDPLPDYISKQWIKHRQELPALTEICVSRSIGMTTANFQLHGFSDASASAYGAVIYSRYILPNGDIRTNIVAAKSRVAPLKQLSIPRLELCGALLLARLLIAVQQSFNLTFPNIYAWCDSQVVLSWLSAPPRRWDIFVGNRTSEILSTIPRNRWFHIRSEQNPADCASRGIAPAALSQHPLWWTGPNWLKENDENWPIIQHSAEHPDCKLEERKNQQRSYLVTNPDHPFEFLSSRISSWNRLVRVVAFTNRFISRCRKLSETTTCQLTTDELFNAKRNLIKWVQNRHFGEYIAHYKLHGHFGKNCAISKLTPFLDDEQILRVGGRIQEANVSFSVQHPIILPKSDPVTTLIARDSHQRFLHPGVSTLFALIRQEYWIIGCRNLLRKITHDCIKCFRQRKATATQIMGNLPAQRIQPSRPFAHCGCDYAGPFLVKSKIGRKTQTTKGYISLFVCMVTKAIHLELVSDLTTDAFLAALRRFIARRGKPSHLYSDNGTNFRGSARVLSEMHQVVCSDLHNSVVAQALARDAITWHFIPPSSPHFGGLWEAGVKSVKQHLRRVIGSDTLSFEEFYTLLTQIEALLNSRPLCSPSDNDLDPLTPAHFLLGESYAAVPEPSLLSIPQNRLSCWQALQNKVQGYWKRWSTEYLTSLQQRPRWSQLQIDLKVDDLVVVKEPNLPPGKWLMGRVMQIHPGKDGHVRVVSLKTHNGTLVRPIRKLALLPIC